MPLHQYSGRDVMRKQSKAFFDNFYLQNKKNTLLYMSRLEQERHTF